MVVESIWHSHTDQILLADFWHIVTSSMATGNTKIQDQMLAGCWYNFCTAPLPSWTLHNWSKNYYWCPVYILAWSILLERVSLYYNLLCWIQDIGNQSTIYYPLGRSSNNSLYPCNGLMSKIISGYKMTSASNKMGYLTDAQVNGRYAGFAGSQYLPCA